MKDDRSKPTRDSSHSRPGPQKSGSSRPGSTPYKSGKPSDSKKPGGPRPGGPNRDSSKSGPSRGGSGPSKYGKPSDPRKSGGPRPGGPNRDASRSSGPRSDKPRSDKPRRDFDRPDKGRSDSNYRDKPRSGDRPPAPKRSDDAPIPVPRPIKKRKKFGLPIRGRRPETPAWIGRLDHPFKVDADRVKQLTDTLQVTTDSESFHKHLELVKSINEEVNLVSRASVDAVLLQSLWESLIPAADSDWRRGPRLLDLGTGGGFPGLPLALALQDTKMTLLDSRRAKTLSLQRMTAELGAKNISVVHDRAETHAERLDVPYDSIVVRAVSVLPEVAQWCEGLLKPGGTLLSWKGPEGEREAKALSGDKWKLLYALPVLPHRYVLVLEYKGDKPKESSTTSSDDTVSG